MKNREIDLLNENLNPFQMVGKDWMLVTAGNEQGFNTMTASWGGFGVMWHKNVVTVVIRPQRKTLEFLNKSGYFTLSFFEEKYREALKFCGSHSGKEDIDKATQCGLTPYYLEGTTAFEQAKTVLVCKKLFAQEINEKSFIDKSLLSNYENGDFHIAFVGEIIKAVEIIK